MSNFECVQLRGAFLKSIGPLAIAILAIAPLAIAHGVPTTLQDWNWPGASSQILPFARAALTAWHPSALGDPATYPSPWVPYVATAALCGIFGVHGGLVALLLLVLVVAFFASYSLARTFDLGPVWCSVGAAFYEVSPVVLNELHAGHWIELISYAMLPYALARFRSPNARSIWVTGLVFGLASGQIQYFFIGLAALGILGTAGTVRRSFGAIAIAIAFVSPEVIIAAIDPHSPSLDIFRPYREWARSQGASLPCAVRALCYIGHYDSALPSWLAIGLFAPLAVAAVGVFATGRRSGLRALLMITLGSVLASGSGSPVGDAWLWAYEHVALAAIFRENYHFAVLTELGTMLGLTCGLSIMARRSLPTARIAALAVSSIVVVLAASASANIPTHDFAELISRTERTGGRFAMYPGVPPWRLKSDISGGFVPLTLEGTDAMPVNGIPLKLPMIAAYAALRECRVAQARAIFEEAGVGILLDVSAISSAFEDTLEPRMRGLIPLRPTPRCSLGALSPRPRLSGSMATVRLGTRANDGRANIEPDLPIPIDLISRSSSPSPSEGWARTALWPTLAFWTSAERPGIFTLLGRAELEIPPSFIIAASARGDIQSPACEIERRLDEHFAVFACRANPMFSGTPPLVVSQAFETSPVALNNETLVTSAEVRVIAASASALVARVSSVGPALLVLRDQYDALWTLDGPGRHVLVDGFYNGWIIPPNRDRLVHVRFNGSLPFTLALGVSITVIALALLDLLRVSHGNSQTLRAERSARSG